MEIIQELYKLKGELEDIIRRAEAEESHVYAKDDEIVKALIKKFVAEHGNIIDKDKQQELYKKVTYCNRRKLSLVKLMKELGVSYEYIKSNKEWKDIKIEL